MFIEPNLPNFHELQRNKIFYLRPQTTPQHTCLLARFIPRPLFFLIKIQIPQLQHAFLYVYTYNIFPRCRLHRCCLSQLQLVPERANICPLMHTTHRQTFQLHAHNCSINRQTREETGPAEPGSRKKGQKSPRRYHPGLPQRKSEKEIPSI